MIEQFSKGPYRISTDKRQLDLKTIHNFLTQSYWAEGIPIEVVKTSIEHSLCFGVYHHNEQVGFARVITDYSTFGYLADVFIVDGHRRKGLSKWLLEIIVGHPELQGLRRWMLVTRDAQGLYRQFGFTDVEATSGVMELKDLDAYKR